MDQINLPRDFNVETLSLVDIALSTSAAPTYFPSYTIGKNKFVDGGVVANNPALFAHTEASVFVENPKTDILHLSLSTGYPSLKDGETPASDSTLYWGLHISDISMDGNRRLTTMCVEKLYKRDEHKRYFRYTPSFPENIMLDDFKQAKLDVMEAAGYNLIYKKGWSKTHPENNHFTDDF